MFSLWIDIDSDIHSWFKPIPFSSVHDFHRFNGNTFAVDLAQPRRSHGGLNIQTFVILFYLFAFWS